MSHLQTNLLLHIVVDTFTVSSIPQVDQGASITNSGDKFDFNVYNIVKQLKMQRIGMVQNKEQYIFCHTDRKSVV